MTTRNYAAEIKALMELHAAVVRNESWSNDKFCDAAHAALGPDGCITRELERLRANSVLAAQTIREQLEEQRAARAEIERLTTDVGMEGP